jgi:lipopolysaccharide/colanic/teichoic acid biosynthesis glycosyltransferase
MSVDAEATVCAQKRYRAQGLQQWGKTCMDYIGAGALVVVLAPLFLLLGLLVAVEDGRPIIYRRRVVGMRGEFDAFKFRSMKKNADTILAADPILRVEFERNFKLKKDPRLTRLGSVLRTHSLDELPQLFNVLKGQMSLVGPRMKTVLELEKYGNAKEIVLAVKPGITGLWQVGGRQNVNYEERIRMDVHYVQNWSLFMDLNILFKTPLKVLRKEGAY